MISARLPVATVTRVDFVVRNIDDEVVISRSAAVTAALDMWLSAQEAQLETLGVIPKKAR